MNTTFPKTKKAKQELIERASLRYIPPVLDDPVAYDQVDRWFEDESDKIKKVFRKEYNSYCEKGLYFFGCKFSIYEATYNDRLQEYLSEFEDYTPLSFIRYELEEEGIFEIKYKNVDEALNRQIKSSLQKRFEFLQDRAYELGYRLSAVSWDKYELESLTKAVDKLEDTYPDLFDSNAKQKIIYLQELGIIDYLRGISKFGISNHKLASLLSAITGEHTNTLQSYLNPINNNTVDQSNNPYENHKNVNHVRKMLSNLGLVPDLGTT
ncbi:hypothetical protein [Gilvibacter sp.]|uniref:hypothetical protein n=1 Tax=Gilvibacter sp. TaxID=2729997 RepID=UPI003B52E933